MSLALRVAHAAMVCVLSFATLAHAAEPVPPIVADVRARMASEPVLRGDFEQRKTLKGFKNPVVSRGDFLVARERGVIWRTREPFASTLTVTRDRLLVRGADGGVTSRITARDEPGMQMVNETLFALMSADLQALAQRFRIEGELQGKDAWHLTLVPRDAALAQAITRIELEGDRNLRSVRLVEAQGDFSLIRFTQQTASPALTPDEAQRFE
ncbi:MAG: lipoprotein carrier protein LolA [Rhodoferax sp.]|nr:lipoprotein carrier protein LolA [Rhodoferax sp.]